MKAKEEVKNDLNLNHNKTTVSDDEDEGAVQLADLPVAHEQADETKGGGMTRIKTFICPSDAPYSS